MMHARTHAQITLKYRKQWDCNKGTVAELWPILKRLIFKQCLIYTRLSFIKDSFNNKLYLIIQIKHLFKQYCLKLHISIIV